jgi:predicted metal-dependent hydrolase
MELPTRAGVMDERLRRGIRLFNDQEFFQCHEVMEEAWTLERGPRRVFLQALIHLAVGCYHCQCLNPVGASRQLRKELRTPAAYLRSCEGRSSESREARGCPYIRRSTCSLYPVTAPDCAGRATSNLLKPGQSRVVAQ